VLQGLTAFGAVTRRSVSFRNFPKLSVSFRFVPFCSAPVRVVPNGPPIAWCPVPGAELGVLSAECGVRRVPVGTHFPSSFAWLAAQNRKDIVLQGLTDLGSVPKRSVSFRNFPKLSVSFRSVPVRSGRSRRLTGPRRRPGRVGQGQNI